MLECPRCGSENVTHVQDRIYVCNSCLLELELVTDSNGEEWLSMIGNRGLVQWQ